MIWFGVFALFCLIELRWRHGYALWLAVIAGFIAFFMPNILWQIQILCFLVISLMVLGFWHYYYRRPVQYFEKHPTERKARHYLYQTLTLTHEIKNGCGQEILDDSLWHLRCDDDLPVGAVVVVHKVQGIFLYVKQ